MAAEPPLGQLDPEDQDSDDDDLEIGLMGETPKHFAVQVIYWPHHHCDQIPQRSTLRGGSVFMASEISIHCDEKGMARQSGSGLSNQEASQNHSHGQEAEKGYIQEGDRAR